MHLSYIALYHAFMANCEFILGDCFTLNYLTQKIMFGVIQSFVIPSKSNDL